MISFEYFLVALIFGLTVCDGKDVKSSLTFVIDDTGSMGDDIEQVKNNVNLIFDTVTNSNASQIENFILVTFNDPGRGKLLAKTQDRTVFKRALASIDVDGGGDCPEYAMSGIEKGLETSLPASYFYVFTDASAKDYEKTEHIQSLAIKKQTQVVFLLTGRCSKNKNDPHYKAYFDLAGATSGKVFHMDKDEVGEVIKYIADTVENRKTKVVSKTFPPGEHRLKYPVDGATKDTTVIITGEHPKGEVFNPDGSKAVVKLLVDISQALVLKLLDPKPGTYEAKVSSKSNTSVVVEATTTVNFRIGFSTLKSTSLNTTSTRPIAGIKSYLAIQLITSEDGVELNSIDVVDLDDNIIMSEPVELVDKEKLFYVTKPFVSPEHLFKIAINAFDNKSNTTVRRYSFTPIEPQKPSLETRTARKSPTVKIMEGPKVNADFNEPLNLHCKVEGYPEPKVVWKDTDANLVLPSSLALIEYPYEYISILEINKVDKNDTYICIANIDESEKSDTIKVETERKFYFNVIELPKDVTIEYEKQGLVTCKVDAFPAATIAWYMNGRQIVNNDKYEVSTDLLTIKRMEPDMAGKYMCEARNEFNRRVSPFTINISGLEAPVIQKGNTTVAVLKGSDVKLTCRLLRGIPTPKINWLFKPDFSHHYDILAEHGETILIENVSTEQSGTYKCKANNAVGLDTHIVKLIVEYKPTIKKDVSTVKAIEGTEPLLKCIVDGVPAPTISWFLYGMIITDNENRQILRDHSLRIKSSIENSGVYKCQAYNKHGMDTKTVKVDYVVPVKISSPYNTEIITEVNKQVDLPCLADGYPKPKHRWTFRSIDPKITPRIYNRHNPDGSLTLSRIEENQDGFYTCEIIGADRSLNITYRVIVYAPPKIVTDDKNMYRAVEKDLVLRVPCKTTGNPKPEILWSFNRFNIAKGTEWYDIETDGTLVIKNIDIKSRGHYECKAYNHLGEDKKYIMVDVSQTPVAEEPTSNQTLKKGESAKIHCDLPHERMDLLRWFKNEKLITEGELYINEATPRDTGVYTCRVSNFTMSLSASKEVIVEFAPEFDSNVDTNIEFDEGKFVELDCNNAAEPEADVKWWHNGELIDKFDAGPDIVMVLSDIGHYKCEISNKFGNINRIFNIKPSGCLLKILDDFRGNQPLIDPRLFPRFKVISEFLQIPKHESIKLFCPESFARFPGSEINVICEDASTFSFNGASYNFVDLECTSKWTPTIKRKGFRCGKGNTEEIEVGFMAGGKFIDIYGLCFDKDNKTTIYTKQSLHRTLAGVAPKTITWYENDLVPYSFKNMYDCKNQIYRISSVLRKWFHADDECCFTKRQLVNPADVIPGVAQQATFTFLNVIPHWSTCNDLNWMLIEEGVRTLAKSTVDNLLVWTGTSQQLTLMSDLSRETKITIGDPTGEQPVPKYLWKVVQDPMKRSSLAIIQVNVPDVTVLDMKKYTLCNNICNRITWIRSIPYNDVKRGFTYCCEIRDFERAFGFKGQFSPGGDQILYDVSLISTHSLT